MGYILYFFMGPYLDRIRTPIDRSCLADPQHGLDGVSAPGIGHGLIDLDVKEKKGNHRQYPTLIPL